MESGRWLSIGYPVTSTPCRTRKIQPSANLWFQLKNDNSAKFLNRQNCHTFRHFIRDPRSLSFGHLDKISIVFLPARFAKLIPNNSTLWSADVVTVSFTLFLIHWIFQRENLLISFITLPWWLHISSNVFFWKTNEASSILGICIQHSGEVHWWYLQAKTTRYG